LCRDGADARALARTGRAPARGGRAAGQARRGARTGVAGRADNAATALGANDSLAEADLPNLTFAAADEDFVAAVRSEDLLADDPNRHPWAVVGYHHRSSAFRPSALVTTTRRDRNLPFPDGPSLGFRRETHPAPGHLRYRRAAFAARKPPIPWTPPPGGVEEEQTYRPGAEVEYGLRRGKGRAINCRRSM
jgi:hypothetical protein